MRAVYTSWCALLLSLAPSVTHAGVDVVDVLSHSGMCEPSGAVAIPEGSFGTAFVVANDEDNVLRAYAAGRAGPPLSTEGGDLYDYLGLDRADENDKADLEAATWLGGKIYWIGSHSRSGKGRFRPQRQQFFATAARATAGQVEISPVAEHAYNDLLRALDTVEEPDLAEAIGLSDEEDRNLAPEKKGLNIEGLAARPDGASVLIGFRNPLSSDGRALLLPLGNPAAVVEAGEEPALGDPALLDLGGRGVRSLEYSPAEGAYYVVAGPTGSDGSFTLYRWSGPGGDVVAPVEGFAAALAGIPDFSPEAMIVDPSGKRLQLLSDDGDRPLPAGADECGKPLDDGRCPCKELRGADRRFFRSAIISLE